MNKILFCVFILFTFSIADSYDNLLLEELRESKEKEEKEKKDEVLQKEDLQEEYSVLQEEDAKKEPPPPKKNQKKYKADFGSDSKMRWFAGLYIGGQYMATYQGQSVEIFNVSLQGGIFYYVGHNHGVKAYGLGSYNSLGGGNVFSLGAGLDYFYDFSDLKFGLFAGIYVDAPIGSNLIKSPDVIIGVGGNGYINSKNRIELRIGYPVSQDSQLKRTLLFGLGYQYIF